MNQQHIGGRDRQGHGRKIPERVVRNFRIEAGIDDVARADDHDGVAIGDCSRACSHAKITTGARLVLDVELLAETAREISRDNPCKNIGRAAGRKWHDHPHRPRRIGLRPCGARNKRHSCSACRQKQKSASSKVHELPPVGVVPTSPLRQLVGLRRNSGMEGRLMSRRNATWHPPNGGYRKK